MILMMGLVGTGKGTQGQLLAQHLKCPWVSTGDILRTHTTPQLQKHFSDGTLVSDEEMFQVVEAEFARLHADKQQFILDGFPRTLNQARWIVEKIKAGQVFLSNIIFLYAPRDVLKERLLKRGRADDNAQIIEERFVKIDKELVPILEYFKREGIMIHRVDAKPTVEEIAADIRQTLGIE